MIKSTCRIALTLGLIAVSVIWIAHGLKLIPDSVQEQVQARLQFCDSLAVTAASFADQHDSSELESIVDRLGNRIDGLQSIRIVKGNEKIAEWGEHPEDWQPSREHDASTSERMVVAILANNKVWGQVQVSFIKLNRINTFRSIILILFMGSAVTLLAWLFLYRTLKYLNPSKVVPNRVRNALDVIAEGLVLQDVRGQIVMANRSFMSIVDRELNELMGESPDDFQWQLLRGENKEVPTEEFPWNYSLEQSQPIEGVMIGLQDESETERKFIVNSTPLMAENGKCRGALTSFQDVTALENKRLELSNMLSVLQKSRDEIRRQNESLQYLASRDSLTGCLNRRSFFEIIDGYWEETTDTEMSVIMLDIDKFKSINDNYGHSFGDDVIKLVSTATLEIVGEKGAVCRYGGEEFCLAIPNMSYAEAMQLGDEIRKDVERTRVGSVSVTVSVGVSSRKFLAMDVQHMLEQADQSLYVAKNAGRNQVVGWETGSKGMTTLGGEENLTGSEGVAVFVDPVEHEAIVSALYSSLYYRDRTAAEHSARVANLCLATAQGIVSESNSATLRVAALLHDIGRIGVYQPYAYEPSASQSRNQASNTEREIRSREIARSICQSASVSSEVTEIIVNYQRSFEDGAGLADLNDRLQLSLCCRILAVCEAFDALMFANDHCTGIEIKQALQTLQKDCPQRFDFEILKRLAQAIKQDQSCMLPMKVSGAQIDESLLSGSADVVAAAEAGNLAPLRVLVKRLKREALGEDDQFQVMISQLESSLNQNDRELQELFQTTQDLLELCRTNRQVNATDQLYPIIDHS